MLASQLAGIILLAGVIGELADNLFTVSQVIQSALRMCCSSINVLLDTFLSTVLWTTTNNQTEHRDTSLWRTDMTTTTTTRQDEMLVGTGHFLTTTSCYSPARQLQSCAAIIQSCRRERKYLCSWRNRVNKRINNIMARQAPGNYGKLCRLDDVGGRRA